MTSGRTDCLYLEGPVSVTDNLQQSPGFGCLGMAYQGDLELEPLVSEGAILLNVYSVITVYNDKTTTEKIEMANNFVNFMISPETQADIDNYGKEKYGKNLFSAMNGNCSRFNCVCTGEATAIEPMTVFNAGSLNAPFAKIETVYESQFPLVDDPRQIHRRASTVLDRARTAKTSGLDRGRVLPEILLDDFVQSLIAAAGIRLQRS